MGLRYFGWGHHLFNIISVLLGFLEAMRRRQTEPHMRLYEVLADSSALGVQHSQIILCISIPSLRCDTPSLGRFGVVLLQAKAVSVHFPQHKLCGNISLVRQLLGFFISLGILTSVISRFTVIETGMSKGSESDH